MTLKTLNITKKDSVGDYGSFSNKFSKGTFDEESQELPLLSRPQQLGGQSLSQPSSKPVPTSAALQVAELSNDQQSYGTSFQLDETSSTHVSSLLETKTRAITTSSNSGGNNGTLREIAMRLSLYVNLAILAAKAYVYIKTLSLAVLAALLDSLLDVVSQLVLYYTERTSDLRSSEIYPAGAARSAFIFSNIQKINLPSTLLTKFALLPMNVSNTVIVRDSTMEALALDHLNDCLSNVVAAIALTAVIFRPWLWWVDPVGAIVISAYIMYSWFSTGREQIEQLTGKAAPADFVEELREIASNYDPRVVVDVCRAYHFGPKFLVELEIVLPKDTLLFESHDIGMDLQYEIEAREEVERCFVHIDYEKREYDEHVVSKVPELLAFIRNSDQVDVRRSISM